MNETPFIFPFYKTKCNESSKKIFNEMNVRSRQRVSESAIIPWNYRPMSTIVIFIPFLEIIFSMIQ